MKNYDNAEHPDFESYLLIHASPDTVFQWLKEHYLQPNPTWNATAGRSNAMEKVLIERDEPIIKLGLALFTKFLSDDAALSLFQNGDMTIKKAVLAGPLVRNARPLAAGSGWVFVILEELLHSFDGNIELLRFFLSNEPSVHVITDLYGKTGLFKDLTDEQWLSAIGFTIPLREDTSPFPHYVLPEDLYKWSGASWKLFETLPVNDRSATILSRLEERLTPYGQNVIGYTPSDMDLPATIKRWEKTETEEDPYFFDCHYRRCRATLGRLLEEDVLRDSDDIALRQAYYNGRYWDKPEDVFEAYEKDKGKFLDVALRNTTLYVKRDVRNALEDCCLKHLKEPRKGISDPYPREFQYMCDRLKGKYPEWFAESILYDDPLFT